MDRKETPRILPTPPPPAPFPLIVTSCAFFLFFFKKRSKAFTRIQRRDKTQPPRSLTKTRSISLHPNRHGRRLPRGHLKTSYFFLNFFALHCHRACAIKWFKSTVFNKIDHFLTSKSNGRNRNKAFPVCEN